MAGNGVTSPPPARRWPLGRAESTQAAAPSDSAPSSDFDISAAVTGSGGPAAVDPDLSSAQPAKARRQLLDPPRVTDWKAAQAGYFARFDELERRIAILTTQKPRGGEEVKGDNERKLQCLKAERDGLKALTDTLKKFIEDATLEAQERDRIENEAAGLTNGDK